VDPVCERQVCLVPAQVLERNRRNGAPVDAGRRAVPGPGEAIERRGPAQPEPGRDDRDQGSSGCSSQRESLPAAAAGLRRIRARFVEPNPVHPHRLGDVLERLLAQIVEREAGAARHLALHLG
jgi:hypothetical protein